MIGRRDYAILRVQANIQDQRHIGINEGFDCPL